MPVGALAEAVGKSVPSVSQHLAKLRMTAMVECRQEGNRVFYRLINMPHGSWTTRCTRRSTPRPRTRRINGPGGRDRGADLGPPRSRVAGMSSRPSVAPATAPFSPAGHLPTREPAMHPGPLVGPDAHGFAAPSPRQQH
ncbi:ArsR/SmtB family transcription factor [Brachybacterium epidermidis]|uniref:ArsR/SmtB family transcription factor n=1 Tax=Brachybacterium epidermidis TaxID=2781983 RepID=UPI00398F1331